jgi:hypothetical protein
MRLRPKPWQVALIAVAFLLYIVSATFGVYGSFYVGYPPYTPAFLNHTIRPIVRAVRLERRTRLHVWGEITSGQVALQIDGKDAAVFIGRFDRGVILEAGAHTLRFDNRESTGRLEYALQ